MAAAIRLSQQHSCSLDHLVGGAQQRRWYVKSENPCGLQIDDELELRRPYHRQVRWLLPLEDAPCIDANLPIPLSRARSVAHQAADFDILAEWINRGQPIVRRQRDELHTSAIEQLIGSDRESVAAGLCARLAKAASISPLLLAVKTSICLPIAEAVACKSLVNASVLRLFGLSRTAKRSALGRSSCKSPSRLVPSSAFIELTPVTLPLGRLRLATRPISTGSAPTPKTIGTVAVPALAASAAGVLAGVAITATPRCTKSPSNSGSRALSLYAKRNSTATLRPSMKPVSFKPLRNAPTTPALSSGTPGYTNPITGIPGCCAPAASGHAAAPPSSVMNSRRFIVAIIRSPRRRAAGMLPGGY